MAIGEGWDQIGKMWAWPSDSEVSVQYNAHTTAETSPIHLLILCFILPSLVSETSDKHCSGSSVVWVSGCVGNFAVWILVGSNKVHMVTGSIGPRFFPSAQAAYIIWKKQSCNSAGTIPDILNPYSTYWFCPWSRIRKILAKPSGHANVVLI